MPKYPDGTKLRLSFRSSEPLDERNGVTYEGLEFTDELDQPALKCPVCGFRFAHVRGAFRHDARSTWASYGNASVEIEGECGHNWLIVFNDHKGEVYLETLVLPDDPDNTHHARKDA